jgi:hypothetical protein
MSHPPAKQSIYHPFICACSRSQCCFVGLKASRDTIRRIHKRDLYKFAGEYTVTPGADLRSPTTQDIASCLVRPGSPHPIFLPVTYLAMYEQAARLSAFG